MSRKSSPVAVIQTENPAAQQQALVRSERAHIECPQKKNNHPEPSVAKKPRSRVPLPQVERIKQRYILGQSERKIAREEGRSRPAISRIVHSADMQEFTRKMREQFYALAFDALMSIRYTLQNNQDPRLAYKLLTDIGVIPSPEALTRATMQQSAPDGIPLTPFESASLGLARMAEQASLTYGFSLPTPEEMKHNLEIAQEIDKETGGHGLSLSLSNPSEWNRLKSQMEARLKDARK
jgi:hypothetical protein